MHISDLKQGFNEVFGSCHNYIKIQICYAPESLFYPFPFIFLFINFGILCIFAIVIKWIRSTGTFAKLLPNTSTAISAASVVVSILVLFIPYIALTPILNYDVNATTSGKSPNIQMNVRITNYGIVAAKHLILSMNGYGKGIAVHVKRNSFKVHTTLSTLCHKVFLVSSLVLDESSSTSNIIVCVSV